jgi:hypothetical protein
MTSSLDAKFWAQLTAAEFRSVRAAVDDRDLLARIGDPDAA